MPDIAAELMAAVRSELAYWRGLGPVPPPPETLEEPRRHLKLAWVETDIPPRPEEGVEAARERMVQVMEIYAREGGADILLVKAPAGLGKTHAAIHIAQAEAQAGQRVIYFMPLHTHWATMTRFPHFIPARWHHWLSYNTPAPDRQDEDMCRLSQYTGTWMDKGYPLLEVCQSVCALYMNECPYRAQAHHGKPITAAIHEHVVTGLSAKPFDLGIVDEQPLRAFMRSRLIPRSGIVMPGAWGPIGDLQQKLHELSEAGRALRGPDLMVEIGPALVDVYAQFEDTNFVPAIPLLQTAQDIANAGYWYLRELLTLLVSEWHSWQQGADDWVSRVVITRPGLYILDKPAAWQKLPSRTIILDATANYEMYRAMFPEHEIELHEPEVIPQGRVIQVAGSTNNKTSMVSRLNGARTKAHKISALIRYFCRTRGYTKPGVISFLDLEELNEAVIPGVIVSHYYGQRGSNSMEECDAVFVVGAPSPPDLAVLDMAAMLYRQRAEPLPRGRTIEYRPYRYRRNGLVPVMETTGFWQDPHMTAVLRAHREDEILQAAHRGRPLVREGVDVYLLTSVPTDLPLDEFYESYEEALGVPDGITWEQWEAMAPWLANLKPGDLITYADLAEAAGVSEGTARRQRYLDALLSRYPALFAAETLTTGRQGRPPRGLSVTKAFVSHN